MLNQEEIRLIAEGLNTLTKSKIEPFPLQSFSTSL